MNKDISYFNAPITNIIPAKVISLSELHEEISSEKHKAITEKLRELPVNERAEFKKQNFPAVTVSGICSGPRKDINMTIHSGKMVVDIDGLTPMEVIKCKFDLDVKKENSPLISCNTSVSGTGVKIILKINPSFTQRDNYLAAINWLKSITGISDEKFDKTGSNVSRLNFIGYDKAIRINEKVNGDDISAVNTLDTLLWLGKNEKDLGDKSEQEERNPTEFINNVFENSYQTNAQLDFDHKAERINFIIILGIAIKKIGIYKKGNRHTFIQYLTSIANRFGIPKAYFIQYCKDFFTNHQETKIEEDPFSIEKELVPVIEDTYSRYADQFSTWVERELVEELETPHFPEEIYDSLPDLIKRPCTLFHTATDKDTFLMGLLGILSNWTPRVQGVYNGKYHGANLFIFISAPASSGKGILHWPRKLGKYITQYLTDKFKKEFAEYEIKLKEYEKAKASGEEAEKPIKPLKQKFFLPGNSSTAAIIFAIFANHRFGLIYETEADSLTSALKNDWGNFSDIIRKAFHHEPIQHLRRKDEEDLEIENPYMSMVLSGTPAQINRLVSSIENGFFSRILFYDFTITPEWKDVFAEGSTLMEQYFDAYAKKLHDLYFPYFVYAGYSTDEFITFELTTDQQKSFNSWFAEKQEQLLHIYGADIVASIRRLAVCFFRITMILTVARNMERKSESNTAPGSETKLACSDVDYKIAENIINTLLFHTIKIYRDIKKTKRNKYSAGKKELFLQKLPAEFNRSQAMDIASFIGIKEKTAENYISKFISSNHVQRVEHNSYKKM